MPSPPIISYKALPITLTLSFFSFLPVYFGLTVLPFILQYASFALDNESQLSRSNCYSTQRSVLKPLARLSLGGCSGGALELEQNCQGLGHFLLGSGGSSNITDAVLY